MGIPPTPLPRHNKTGALLPQCAGFVYGINVQEKGNGWKLKLEEYRTILSADTASEVRRLLSKKRREYFVLQR